MRPRPVRRRLRHRLHLPTAPITGPSRAYVPHAYRQALRRVQRRRTEAAAGGEPVPDRAGIETLLHEGRARGLLGRRRLVSITVDLSGVDLESGLWRTGARSIDEYIIAALLAASMQPVHASTAMR